ncbi:class I SAM-dependent methyltransferase [Scytonema sp. UIC 10036]|uniref:class I SAM-dependent methyltransferase n=1 Tax=Scytonema sp. UIC 10036 TaxID=2304196 RepID=UPI00325B055E
MFSVFTQVDFACGNGTQTKFLAQCFPSVIGIDVSKSAIEIASTENTAVGSRMPKSW